MIWIHSNEKHFKLVAQDPLVHWVNVWCQAPCQYHNGYITQSPVRQEGSSTHWKKKYRLELQLLLVPFWALCWCSFLFSLDGVFPIIRWIGKGVSDWPIHQNKSYYFWLYSPNSIHILNYKVAQCDTKKQNSVKVNLPFFTLLGKDWTRFAPNIRCTYNFDHFSHQKFPFTKVLEKEIFSP